MKDHEILKEQTAEYLVGYYKKYTGTYGLQKLSRQKVRYYARRAIEIYNSKMVAQFGKRFLELLNEGGEEDEEGREGNSKSAGALEE